SAYKPPPEGRFPPLEKSVRYLMGNLAIVRRDVAWIFTPRGVRVNEQILQNYREKQTVFPNCIWQ
ncbi:MAG: hypothetical protein AAFR30_13625, partial [Cyanobacteria bacterium J06628_4]